MEAEDAARRAANERRGAVTIPESGSNVRIERLNYSTGERTVMDSSGRTVSEAQYEAEAQQRAAVAKAEADATKAAQVQEQRKAELEKEQLSSGRFGRSSTGEVLLKSKLESAPSIQRKELTPFERIDQIREGYRQQDEAMRTWNLAQLQTQQSETQQDRKSRKPELLFRESTPEEAQALKKQSTLVGRAGIALQTAIIGASSAVLGTEKKDAPLGFERARETGLLFAVPLIFAGGEERIAAKTTISGVGKAATVAKDAKVVIKEGETLASFVKRGLSSVLTRGESSAVRKGTGEVKSLAKLTSEVYVPSKGVVSPLSKALQSTSKPLIRDLPKAGEVAGMPTFEGVQVASPVAKTGAQKVLKGVTNVLEFDRVIAQKIAQTSTGRRVAASPVGRSLARMDTAIQGNMVLRFAKTTGIGYLESKVIGGIGEGYIRLTETPAERRARQAGALKNFNSYLDESFGKITVEGDGFKEKATSAATNTNFRSLASGVTLLAGSKEDFEKAARTELASRGFKGEELEAAVKLLKRERTTRGITEIFQLLNISRLSERFGTGEVVRKLAKTSGEKVAAKGAGWNLAGKVFFPISRAGAFEGLTSELVNQDTRMQERNWMQVFGMAAFGSVTAGVLGSAIAGTMVNKRITSKGLLMLGYLGDPYEWPGDVLSELQGKALKKAGIFETEAVIKRPMVKGEVFSFGVSSEEFGGSKGKGESAGRETFSLNVPSIISTTVDVPFNVPTTITTKTSTQTTKTTKTPTNVWIELTGTTPIPTDTPTPTKTTEEQPIPTETTVTTPTNIFTSVPVVTPLFRIPPPMPFVLPSMGTQKGKASGSKKYLNELEAGFSVLMASVGKPVKIIDKKTKSEAAKKAISKKNKNVNLIGEVFQLPEFKFSIDNLAKKRRW